MFNRIVLWLGGKKMTAWIGGVLSIVLLWAGHLISKKFGVQISDDAIVKLAGEIAGIIAAMLIGQGVADGMSRGATSSAPAIAAMNLNDVAKRLDAAPDTTP